MFLGHSKHSLDAKGRVILPARFREVLAKRYDDRVVLTLSHRGVNGSLDRCLYIYPWIEFDQVLERLRAAPQSDPAVVAFKRYVLGYAEEYQMDKQGRVLVPPHLREMVGLDREVALVGDNNLIQAWSIDEWNKAQDVQDVLLDNLDRLAGYGI